MDKIGTITANAEFLKTCEQFIVPSTCLSIHDAIKSYYSKCIIDSLYEVSKALDFVVPYIIHIKSCREQYSTDNTEYKKHTVYLYDMCTSVASLLLDKIVGILNVAIESGRPSSSDIANKLLQGRDILYKMKSLYLFPDFINKRLNPNFETVNQMFSHFDVGIFQLPKPYDLRTELEVFNECKKSETDCEYYLAKYPVGRYRNMVIDLQYSFKMKEIKSVDGYYKYLEKNPKGLYVEDAIAKINEYTKYKSSISILSFKELKEEHVKKLGTFLHDSVDDVYFFKCKKNSHFKNYVALFGEKSRHYQEAKKQADNDYSMHILILSVLTTGLIGGIIGGFYGNFMLGFIIGIFCNLIIPVCLLFFKLYLLIVD